jgi:hypothetical protein
LFITFKSVDNRDLNAKGVVIVQTPIHANVQNSGNTWKEETIGKKAWKTGSHDKESAFIFEMLLFYYYCSEFWNFVRPASMFEGEKGKKE